MLRLGRAGEQDTVYFFNERPDFLLQTSSAQISVELLIDGFLASGNCKLIAAEMASEDKYSAGCLQGERTGETLDAIFGALSPPLTVFLIFVSA